MTLKETVSKINSLQELIGEEVPKWNSTILEMMPAPNNEKFVHFVETFLKTQSIEQAVAQTGADDFEILLIFRSPRKHGILIYEWYSFFYSDNI